MPEAQNPSPRITDFGLWYKVGETLFARKDMQGPEGFTREEVGELARQVLFKSKFQQRLGRSANFKVMLEERECYVYLDSNAGVSWPRLKTGTSEQYIASRKLYFGRTDNPDMLAFRQFA